MLGYSVYGASVLVPNQGWVIFGGFGSYLTTVQILKVFA
jgi:hypothetical protein